MREILFRGKSVKNGEWAYGDLITNSKKLYIHPKANMTEVSESGLSKLVVMHEVIPETVGQHTGITDINGKKIFEGDIVEYNVTKHKVVYEQRNGSAYFGIEISPFETLSIGHYTNMCLKIIGNIHDTPELLVDEKEKINGKTS